MTKEKNWILFLSLQIIILLVATFVDLEISHKVFTQGNHFGFSLDSLVNYRSQF